MPDESIACAAALLPLDAISAILAERPDGGDDVARFARRLYGSLAPEDLRSTPPAHLAAAALSLMSLARRRLPCVAKVHVFNPRPDEPGWSAARTIVQLVNDDMPFLVDSVTAEFARRDLQVHLIAHPVLHVRRDASGAAVSPGHDDAGPRELLMHIEIDRQNETAALDDLAASLTRIFAEVRLAVEDWMRMRAACLAAVADLHTARGVVSAEDIAETQAFLRWIETHRFTFLGYRRYRYTPDGAYDLVSSSGLGILRQPDERLFGDGSGNSIATTGLASHRLPLLLLKTDRLSLVHRPGPMDCVIVKAFDGDGRAVGEHRFAGLFTSVVYQTSPAETPILRRKVAAVIQRARLDPESHDGKSLIAILHSWPRDELFQIEEDALYDAALGVLQLQERQRTAMFERRDVLGRFVSCLVFVPRDRWDSSLRRRFTRILSQAYGGHLASYSATIDDASTLARVLFVIRRDNALAPFPDAGPIEDLLVEAVTTWADRLKSALLAARGDAAESAALHRWGEGFPTSYRETFGAAEALDDLRHVASVEAGAALGIKLERRPSHAPHEVALKLFHAATPIPLSDILPPLENMGLRVLTETPYRLAGPDGRIVWLHDFLLAARDGSPIEVTAIERGFETALARIWSAELESDGLSRLALSRAMDWRDIALLRGYARYLRQTGIPFGQDYMEHAITANAAIAAKLVELFHARLDPALGEASSDERKERTTTIATALDAMLDAVTSLDDDRILRRFRNAIECTLRTNFFQRRPDGEFKSWISVKLDSRNLLDLPLPRPMVEIFVYSPRTEGVHLRGGKVARGGIRWSDRREDFRIEILGLMKAQMVKNAVIVPVGSKGGFYVKRPPVGGSREELQAEGVESYRVLIRGMLDITDNIAESGIVPPSAVVRHDGDDPYLVVAADKGTATFSDTANALAAEYGFWLGDAFASGGSRGYDHKEMGITARGAWEAVKRHFRDLGTDIQKTSFTVAGVGDMSGDVFGNAMLLSQKIRLLAAFDHRHIFLDPDPDPARSWQERKRLFDLPRSSWADYDKALISPGGGVFPRSAKAVELSPQIRTALGIQADRLAPADLMRAILGAAVDLLWFGGIGTFIRASDENALEIGDRANDALRITGSAVRGRVIGEGANLGVTQRGRIEAAWAGIHLNTDALDNSAGVDTSDHEVNIKIALNRAGAALDGAARDALLVQMTEEVAELVLRNNYQQSQAIGVAAAQSQAMHQRHARMMHTLQRESKLDRAVEFLPDDDAMRSRAAANQPLTRPELCVLLAYAKIALSDEILDSELPDDPLLEAELLRYFPAAMREHHADLIRQHRLRREIVTLQAVNSLVNRAGSTFVHDLADRTGNGAADIARAFAVARDAWRLREIWAAIEALDSALVAPAQTEMLIATQRFLERSSIWLLQNVPQPMNMLAAADRFRPAVDELARGLRPSLPDSLRSAVDLRAGAFATLGAPTDLALRVAELEVLASAGDIVLLSEGRHVPVPTVAALFFALGSRLGIDWLMDASTALPQDATWSRQALSALGDDLQSAQRTLTANVLVEAGGKLGDWIAARKSALTRYDSLLAELRSIGKLDLAALAVMARELRTLERT